jgi:hypothetical protein
MRNGTHVRLVAHERLPQGYADKGGEIKRLQASVAEVAMKPLLRPSDWAKSCIFGAHCR